MLAQVSKQVPAGLVGGQRNIGARVSRKRRRSRSSWTLRKSCTVETGSVQTSKIRRRNGQIWHHMVCLCGALKRTRLLKVECFPRGRPPEGPAGRLKPLCPSHYRRLRSRLARKRPLIRRRRCSGDVRSRIPAMEKLRLGLKTGSLEPATAEADLLIYRVGSASVFSSTGDGRQRVTSKKFGEHIYGSII